jgi:hypothetical protein
MSARKKRRRRREDAAKEGRAPDEEDASVPSLGMHHHNRHHKRAKGGIPSREALGAMDDSEDERAASTEPLDCHRWLHDDKRPLPGYCYLCEEDRVNNLVRESMEEVMASTTMGTQEICTQVAKLYMKAFPGDRRPFSAKAVYRHLMSHQLDENRILEESIRAMQEVVHIYGQRIKSRMSHGVGTRPDVGMTKLFFTANKELAVLLARRSANK